MEKAKINVLIGDDTAEFGVRIAAELREAGIYAYTRRNNGVTILDSLIRSKPDVAVIDLTTPEMDAIVLMRKAAELMDKRPVFIVVSDINNSFIERQITEGGAEFFLPKPFETSQLCSAIKSLYRNSTLPDSGDIELMVTDIIHKLGVPAHIKGYHYLRTAIICSVEDRRLMDSVTKLLYPIVANQHCTTSSRVERAIRHAIEIAWDRGNCVMMNDFFGYTISGFSCRPTNSEFIALLSDRLRLKLKNNTSYKYTA